MAAGWKDVLNDPNKKNVKSVFMFLVSLFK